MSSAKRDSLISYYLIWMPFISFFYVTALARSFRTILRRGSKRKYLYLIPNLREKLSISDCMMLVMVLPYIAFIVLRYINT
jgi:ABC-type phosphate transport system permease subunit